MAATITTAAAADAATDAAATDPDSKSKRRRAQALRLFVIGYHFLSLISQDIFFESFIYIVPSIASTNRSFDTTE